MTAVSKAQAIRITKELEEAITAVFARNGLTSPKFKTTYGNIYKIAAEGTPVVLDESGADIGTPEARAYLQFASSYGLNQGLLGKTVRDDKGNLVTFVGIALSRSRFPLAFRKEDGRQIFYPQASQAGGTPSQMVKKLNAL